MKRANDGVGAALTALYRRFCCGSEDGGNPRPIDGHAEGMDADEREEELASGSDLWCLLFVASLRLPRFRPHKSDTKPNLVRSQSRMAQRVCDLHEHGTPDQAILNLDHAHDSHALLLSNRRCGRPAN